MKRILTSIMMVLIATTAIQAAKPRSSLKIYATKKQTVTGFGGACCDGAMKPFGNDNGPISKLYGKRSKIGLNILRMEISPNLEDKADQWGDYDWNGSLPSAKSVKDRGGIVFGTPWSPPGVYKTNGTAQGGNAKDQGNQEGRLSKDCYKDFFPWLNTFLKWMKNHGVVMDAVSIQNEPDWWVSYSGCLYEPQEQVDLIKNYAHLLDRETYNGVRIISAEPLGYRKDYFDALLADNTCREQVDIFAGHIYGHMPLQYIKPVAQMALPLGKEVWMTEHSVTDNIDHLPNWQENLIFAEELNECMQAGCTGYIYWYLRAHWSFCGTGESWGYSIWENGEEIKKTASDPNNKKDELLPRAFVMSHFSKNVTGSTRLETSQDANAGRQEEGKLQDYQFSAYQKGDSIIVMAINTTANSRDLVITLPENVYTKSGELWLSTGNESENLCQKSKFNIEESINKYTYEMPAGSLNTIIFTIDKGSTAIENMKYNNVDGPKTYYDLQGRKLDEPHGLCIERSADGSSRKVMM